MRWTATASARTQRAIGTQGAAGTQGECVGSGGQTGGVGSVSLQAGQVSESWSFYSGSSGHVTPDASYMRIFKSCNKFLRVASGTLLPIEGHRDLTIDFRSGTGTVRIELEDVAYVPRLTYHLLSLPTFAKKRNYYVGDKSGTRLCFLSGKKVNAPFVGKLNLQYGVRVNDDIENACAVIAPGLLPTTGIDIKRLPPLNWPYPRTLAATLGEATRYPVEGGS